jgi:EmrB/QacA subfamily drug resistance transporter
VSEDEKIKGSWRGYAFIALCLGALMIGVDGSIVTLALGSIRTGLHVPETRLVWVINAYLLTFASFMLLAGRLGDLYGHRRIFLLGIMSFSLASLGCGLAGTQWFLICARAAQGVAGAVVWVLALSLTLTLYTVSHERAKAMAVFGFVTVAGSSFALLLGGTLLTILDWHWIFLVNVPIGVAVFALTLAFLPKDRGVSGAPALDVGGALAMTSSLLLAIYAIVEHRAFKRPSGRTLELLGASVVLLFCFILIESHARWPLVPLNVLRRRNLFVCAVIEMIVTAAVYAWGFLCALYLQRVLRYSPMAVGLAFLPANVIAAVLSLGLSSRLAIRFGYRRSLTVGLLLMAIGFAFFAYAPVSGRYVIDVLPGMILVGVGLGTAPTPLTLAAMSDISPGETGLASGVINTASLVGGSLGLAVLVSIAAARTEGLAGRGNPVLALNTGYHVAFLIATVLTVAAGLVGAVFLTTLKQKLVETHEQTAVV